MTSKVELLSAYRSARVVVTGATGFLGTHLCRALLNLGAEVSAVSRRRIMAPDSGESGRLKWYQIALENEDEVTEFVGEVKPDIIFHASGMVHGRQDLESVRPALNANLLSTVNLATASIQSGNPSLVLMGSMEESDVSQGDSAPVSPYAASKEACHTYAKLFASMYHVPIVNCRIFMVYGPGQPYINKLIPYTIMSLANKESPTIGAGTREIDWVFIDDVVNGLLRAALIEDKTAQRIDLGGGRMVSIRWVVDAIARIMGSSVEIRYGTVVHRQGDERVCQADLPSTAEQLGWVPETSLELGLQKTVRWYCENKDRFQQEWELLHNPEK